MNRPKVLLPLLIFFGFSLVCQNSKVNKEFGYSIDSMHAAIRAATNDTTRAIAYTIIGSIHLTQNPDSSRIYFERSAKICESNLSSGRKLQPLEKLSYGHVLGTALTNIGTSYYLTGNIPGTIKYYEKSLRVLGENHDSIPMATLYNNLAAAYGDVGDRDKQMDAALRALDIYKKVNDPTGIARGYAAVGGCYLELDDIQKAMEYYSKSLDLRLKTKEKKGLSSAYFNVSLCYGRLNDSTNAILYLNKSLDAAVEAENLNSQAYAITAIAHLHYDKNNLVKALELFEKGLEIRKKINDRKGIAFSLQKIGQVYLKMNDLEKAKKYATEGLAMAQQSDAIDANMYSCKILSEVAQAQGNWKEAFKMNTLYVLMKDSIGNEKVRKTGLKRLYKEEYRRKSLEDSLSNIVQMREQALLHEQEIKQQRYYTYAGIGAFIFTLSIAVVSIRAYRNKQKANLIITEQKKMVEEQNQIIVEKQKEIIDSIRYAKRIQTAFLASDKYITKVLNKLSKKGNIS